MEGASVSKAKETNCGEELL